MSKQCKKGKPCGKSCIAKSKTCRQKVADATAAKLDKFKSPVVQPDVVVPPINTIDFDFANVKLGKTLGEGALGYVNEIVGHPDKIIKTHKDVHMHIYYSPKPDLSREGVIQAKAADAGFSPKVYSYDKDHLVTDKVIGQTLSSITKTESRGALEGRALEMILDFHEKTGIAHNDLHGSNIMVGDDGKLSIIDFGLAVDGGDTKADFKSAVGRLRSANTVISDRLQKAIDLLR
jgi:predicted Ser/Thr protein kinase